jgi:phosphotransferase system HPr-like phosphotransfer protein
MPVTLRPVIKRYSDASSRREVPHSIEGRDAKEAMRDLEQLIQSGFDEDAL